MPRSHNDYDRRPIFIGATLQICDPETFKPLGKPLAAVAVDVSMGGMRFELHNVPASLDQTIGPDITISASFDSKQLKLSDAIYLNVAWFHPHLGRDSSARAAVGGYFKKISDADRAELLRQADLKAKTGPSRPARKMLLGASFFGLFIALLVSLFQLNSAQDQLGELSWRVDQLSAQLVAERARARRIELERLSSKQTAVPVRATAEVRTESRVPTAVAVSDQDRNRSSSSKAKPLEFAVKGNPEGIGLVSLELLQGDFVGVLSNLVLTDREVAVAVEYGCRSRETSDRSLCVCETPRMLLHKNSKLEFACSSGASPRSDDQPVQVTIR